MIARAAEAAIARAIDRLAAAAADELPDGVTVGRRDDGLVLSGRGLLLRWLGDARLRGLALLARRDPG